MNLGLQFDDTDLIERIARAIHNSEWAVDFDKMPPESVQVICARRQARAVVDAIGRYFDELANQNEKVVCMKCRGVGEYEQPRDGFIKSFVICTCAAGDIQRQVYYRKKTNPGTPFDK